MKRRKEGVIFILGIVLVVILLNINTIFGAEDNVSINFNYQGRWASAGFSDVYSWRHFVDVFVNIMLNLKIIDQNGTMGLVAYDNFGNQKIIWDWAHFNNNTCALTFGMNLTLPLGVKKDLNYDIALNNDKNICHINDYKKYLNKTLKEILLDLGKNNITALFIGKTGNISVVPSKNFDVNNPNFTVIMVHAEDDTHPLLPEVNFTSMNLTTMTLNELNITYINNITIVNNKESENTTEENIKNTTNNVQNTTKETNTTKKVFKIINPKPSNFNVNTFINEKVDFSIENTEYDSISWILDGKVVGNNGNSYVFSSENIGEYRLKVEINKSLESKVNSWKIIVAKSKENNSFNYIYLILIVIIVIIIIVFVIFKINSSKNTKPTVIVNNYKPIVK